MKHQPGIRKLQQQLEAQNEQGLEFINELQQNGIKLQCHGKRKLLFSLKSNSITCNTAKQKHKKRGGLDL